MLNCVAFEKVTHSFPDESNDAELMIGTAKSGSEAAEMLK
jgi:hypothetical protein